jgi:diaminohydroxyphosphoribosylaminopyrimidine deaminase/5-amino-6-(5-phosphoribosylamino)uracil reductase
MHLALDLARNGLGRTSPNPMVGAVLVKAGRILGQGWHREVGGRHAEIEALRAAEAQRRESRGACLYVTLEPCSTQGRTPPCTEAILRAGIGRVVVGSVDPNPAHAGRGLALLRRAGVEVVAGVLERETTELNAAFNHWIVHRTPWVTLKAGMTLDGKIATARGESRWITGPAARALVMEWRRQTDALLVGIRTVLADDPSLAVRLRDGVEVEPGPGPRRIVLDSEARTPVRAAVVSDRYAGRTTVVVLRAAPRNRVLRLEEKVRVLRAPSWRGQVDLRWLMGVLGKENVTSLLVEGGGEVHASFLFQGLAHRVAFFYAPKILGGRHARKGVAGSGARGLSEAIRLEQVKWRRVGKDLLLTARPAVRG